MTLKELTNEFLGDLWEAKKYNLASHNCQDFAVEVVKICEAVRINEEDKIRINEKRALPNCLIEALSKNEGYSKVNSLGRIPIFGLFFDLFAAHKYIQK